MTNVTGTDGGGASVTTAGGVAGNRLAAIVSQSDRPFSHDCQVSPSRSRVMAVVNSSVAQAPRLELLC